MTGTVTLLTGDRVTLVTVDGRTRAQVHPGPGRDRIAFSIQDRGGDRAVGLVLHPPGATAVSLRGSAIDADGNAVEQTIIRAYAVAPD